MISAPKPHFSPKPKRLPKRKRMTIAIGVRANDGLVIGADSEESTGFLKNTQQKLMPFYMGMQLGSNPAPPSGICVFTGAGDGGYIDAITEELIDVASDQQLRGVALKKAFGKRLKEFYRDHVVPFAAFPENDRPSMELLIAVQKEVNALYVTDRNTIRSSMPYAAVGFGRSFAKNLLRTYWRPAPVEQIAALAVFVLAAVKENVEDCGKFSSVMMLHNWIIKDNPNALGSMLVPPPQISTRLTGQQIFDLESAFANEHAKVEYELMWDFIARHSSTPSPPTPPL
jgi:hypothetical protein